MPLLISQYLSKCGVLAGRNTLHMALVLMPNDYIACIGCSDNFDYSDKLIDGWVSHSIVSLPSNWLDLKFIMKFKEMCRPGDTQETEGFQVSFPATKINQ